MIAKSTGLVATLLLLSSVAFAQVGITLRIADSSHGCPIPPDFAGIGCETASMLPNRYDVAGYLFTLQNRSLVTLLQNLGVRNIRVGGATVNGFFDSSKCSTPMPSRADIRHLFAFAHEAGVNVIYSFRLLDPRSCFHPKLAEEDADTAQWIWSHYRTNLNSFATGNEPDWHSYHKIDPAMIEISSDVPGSVLKSYIGDGGRSEKRILDNRPNARFPRPNLGIHTPMMGVRNPSSNLSRSQSFASASRHGGNGEFVFQYFYMKHESSACCEWAKTIYPPGSKQANRDIMSTNWVDGTVAPSRRGGSTGGLVISLGIRAKQVSGSLIKEEFIRTRLTGPTLLSDIFGLLPRYKGRMTLNATLMGSRTYLAPKEEYTHAHYQRGSESTAGAADPIS